MKSPITAAQAMSHPAVFETVNALGEMVEQLRAEVDALTKERDAQSKAADHWMTEACAEHNRNMQLKGQIIELAALVKQLGVSYEI